MVAAPALSIVVVSVSVEVDMVENLLLWAGTSPIDHGVQRPGSASALHSSSTLTAVDKGIVVTAQGAAEGGPAPVDGLEADVSAVENRVTGGAVTRP